MSRESEPEPAEACKCTSSLESVGSLREYMKRKRSLFSSASSVSRHAPPKRSLVAPRTVRVPGYTGWCLACLEAAVVSTGGRSRTLPAGSRSARRTAIPHCNKPSSLSHHDGSHRASHLKPCGRRGQHVTAVLSPAGGSLGKPLSPVSYTHLTLPTILLV